jgi:hypothetical protein
MPRYRLERLSADQSRLEPHRGLSGEAACAQVRLFPGAVRPESGGCARCGHHGLVVAGVGGGMPAHILEPRRLYGA